MVPAGVGMIAVAFGLARYGYGLLLPDMRASLGLDVGTAGLIGSSAYLSYLLANAVVVPLTVRTGPRVPLALATGSAVVGMVVIAGSDDVAHLAMGVLVAGASAGFAFPPYADVVSGSVPEGRRPTVWAAISSGTGWGVALAGPVAVLSSAGWRTSWLVFAGVAAVVGLAAVISVPAGRGDSTGPVVRLRPRWFLCPHSRPLLLAAAVVGVGSSIWWSFCVDAMRSAGVGPTTSRMVYAGCGAASILASLTGVVVERAGSRRTHRAAVLGLAGSLALLALLAQAAASFGTPVTTVVVVVAAVSFGITYAGVIAVQGLWSAEVFAERPSAGLAAVNTSLTMGTLVGPALGGWIIATYGYGPALLAAALMTTAALPLAPPLRGRAALPARGMTAAS